LSEHKSKSSNVDDEFEKISKKLNKLKEQHETVVANETKNKQGLSSSSK
jgi:tetrahydromethanopterin S-methyltransferase subunit G